MRSDGRARDALRALKIIPDFTENPLASVLIELGKTRVLCAVSSEPELPRFLRGTGKGWVTAEYSLLPSATHTRVARESTQGKVSGRTSEIQRLIGRSMRAVVELTHLGERTLWIDCDVLQADGGTRTASITGAYVALELALRRLVKRGDLAELPLLDSVAAISVGVVDGEVVLDLPYAEDSCAAVDMNIVATGQGRLVEVQGTGESATFSAEQLIEMTNLALQGITELTRRQREVLDAWTQKL